MARVFLFRHAQSEDNKAGVFSGRRDPKLTEEGEKEAEEIRAFLKNEKVTKAYCAPNTRAKATLEIALKGHKDFEMVADPRLLERDYGDLTGKSKANIEHLYPKEYEKWHRSYEATPPNGESLKQVDERVRALIDEIVQNIWQNDVIFICACGNSLRPIRKYFEKMTDEEMSIFEHTPGKVYSYDA